MQPQGKPTRHSQMFWAAFTYGRRTDLVALYGDTDAARQGVTGRVILECLQENLPTILEPGMTFIQDNAPVHTALVVSEWLDQFADENGIELVDWPAYSPDLNPIENLWKLLKEHIVNKYPDLASYPRNLESLRILREAALEVWVELSDDLLNHLIDTMNHRMQAIIEAQGWYTKY